MPVIIDSTEQTAEGNKMLLNAKPENMILLSKEQHQKYLMNSKVNLVWFNVDGIFIGPYAYPEQIG